MAIPTSKPGLENMLETLAKRTTSITNDVCIPAPFGCGGPATEFRDATSQKEYTISGLCQACQDKMWPPKEV